MRGTNPMSLRKLYYNAFSPFYDKIVALHSSDHQGYLRSFLADKTQLKEGDNVLDICTGTGTLLLHLRQRVGEKGFVVGLDFSRGMLEKCSEKIKAYKNIFIVESEAAMLPFKEKSFNAVTCSHAFYELKGEVRNQTLKEVVRVLKPGSPFLMMEHDVPEKFFIRMLFYMRIFSMGAKEVISILKHEKEFLKRYFNEVEKIQSPTGRSKVMVCRN